jgi:hypothetical protein
MTDERWNRNLALIAANGLLILILAVKLVLQPEMVSSAMKIWLAVTPLITLAVVVKPSWCKVTWPTLYFFTGAAVGMTLSSAVRNHESLWFAQKLWLPLALIAVVYHCRPTRAKTHFA